jgi:hypothetical protein
LFLFITFPEYESYSNIYGIYIRTDSSFDSALIIIVLGCFLCFWSKSVYIEKSNDILICYSGILGIGKKTKIKLSNFDTINLQSTKEYYELGLCDPISLSSHQRYYIFLSLQGFSSGCPILITCDDLSDAREYLEVLVQFLGWPVKEVLSD